MCIPKTQRMMTFTKYITMHLQINIHKDYLIICMLILWTGKYRTNEIVYWLQQVVKSTFSRCFIMCLCTSWPIYPLLVSFQTFVVNGTLWTVKQRMVQDMVCRWLVGEWKRIAIPRHPAYASAKNNGLCSRLPVSQLIRKRNFLLRVCYWQNLYRQKKSWHYDNKWF